MSDFELLGYIILFVTISVIGVGGVGQMFTTGFRETRYAKLGGERRGFACQIWFLIGIISLGAFGVLMWSAWGR